MQNAGAVSGPWAFAAAVSAGLALLGYGILGDAEMPHRDAQIEVNSIASGPDAKFAGFCKEALEKRLSQKTLTAKFREYLTFNHVSSDEKLDTSPMRVCPFPRPADTLDSALGTLDLNPGYALPNLTFLSQVADQLPADSRLSVTGVISAETDRGCIAPMLNELSDHELNDAGFLFEPLSTTSKSLWIWINGTGRVSQCLKASTHDLEFYFLAVPVLKRYLSQILAPNLHYSLRANASGNVDDFNLPALTALREEWGGRILVREVKQRLTRELEQSVTAGQVFGVALPLRPFLGAALCVLVVTTGIFIWASRRAGRNALPLVVQDLPTVIRLSAVWIGLCLLPSLGIFLAGERLHYAAPELYATLWFSSIVWAVVTWTYILLGCRTLTEPMYNGSSQP